MWEEGKGSKASGDSQLNFVAGLVWFGLRREETALCMRMGMYGTRVLSVCMVTRGNHRSWQSLNTAAVGAATAVCLHSTRHAFIMTLA